MAEIKHLRNDTVFDKTQLKQLASKIRVKFSSDYVWQETVCGGNAQLLSFERYFMRTGSYAALTVLLSNETNCTKAVVIGSAGGNGLLNISWGADIAFADEAVRFLLQSGFNIEHPEEY